jgi:hypothetical protein
MIRGTTTAIVPSTGMIMATKERGTDITPLLVWLSQAARGLRKSLASWRKPAGWREAE